MSANMISNCPCVSDRGQDGWLPEPGCRFCGGTGYVRYRLNYDPKPIPDRRADWDAVPFDFEEVPGLYGRGATAEEAIAAMREAIEEVL